MKTGKIHPIVLGCSVWMILAVVPIILQFRDKHSLYAEDALFPLFYIFLGFAMLKHSRVARLGVVVLCLFYAMIIGSDLAVLYGQNDAVFLVEKLPGWAVVFLLIWLAWLLGLSPSARTWFKKSPESLAR
jgi:threonine/homoserine/homoserine lactone efflux protein